MGKFKKGLSDKVRSKLKSKAKSASVNPFEIKVNKVKHTVVNKKVEKWEKGLPGVSRSKAIKKRKDTILNELRQMKKSNALHDKRIGEKDSNLTAEEKMVQRFALERKMQTGKQSAFNLNEDEVVLTHYGQSLAENLKEKPGSDSDDDDHYADRENTGKFQFGGFSEYGEESTWKDKMQEVILDSKKQKYERQMEKEKSFEATKELDGLWKSVVGKMKPQSKQAPNRKMSNFMMLSRSLIMEQRSEGAADKFKTEEQRAREESEKLKKLEVQRLERMRGVEKKIVSDHVSADSLSNGYAVTKKGKMKVSFAQSDESDNEDGGENDEDADQEQDGDDDEESDSGDEEDDDENSGDGDDSYSDLDDDEGEESEDEDESEDQSDDNASQNKSSKDKHKSILKISKPVSIAADVKSGQTDLPFVFEAPTTYEELQVLLHGHSTSDQITILSRLRKCNHPSLAEENKDKLQKIHLFLLQYIGEVVLEKDVDGKLVDALTSHLWELTQTFPSASSKFMQGIVMERQKEFAAAAERRGGRGLFPALDTLVYLRLIEMLFPTSDFRHEVTTPCIHFMAQMLAESSVRTLKDVTCGLYICALCLQFVHSSKRYVPEMTTFLHGVLYLASCDSTSSHTFPPFRKPSKDSCQLELKEKCNDVSPNLSLSQIIQFSETDSNQLRCDLTSTCVHLLHECVTVWSELPCLSLIMKPIDVQIKSLPTNLYPKVLKDKVENLTSRIEESGKVKYKAMQHESKKPEPLALFEPKIQENWCGKRKKGGSNQDVNNRQRMLHKYKREMKSAVREIKRDSAVVAKHKLDTIMQKDAERKRKVKEIMSSLANQEGDYRAIKREKS